MGRLIDEDDLMRLLDEEDSGGFIDMPTEMLKKRLDALLDMPYEDCIACKHRSVEWNEKPCSDCWQGLQGGYEPIADVTYYGENKIISTVKSEPCEDAVSRKDAIDVVMEVSKKIPTIAIRAKDVLEKLPPVTTQKTGKWIKIGEEAGALGITYAEVRCSNCGWSHSLIIPSNFCPNCGAKMMKEE